MLSNIITYHGWTQLNWFIPVCFGFQQCHLQDLSNRVSNMRRAIHPQRDCRKGTDMYSDCLRAFEPKLTWFETNMSQREGEAKAPHFETLCEKDQNYFDCCRYQIPLNACFPKLLQIKQLFFTLLCVLPFFVVSLCFFERFML